LVEESSHEHTGFRISGGWGKERERARHSSFNKAAERFASRRGSFLDREVEEKGRKRKSEHARFIKKESTCFPFHD